MDDERLQSALFRLSERAPDPEGVLAGLESRSRALRTRRRVLLGLGGVAAVAAVAGPVAALRPWESRGGSGTPAASAATPGDPLPFRPTWLPPGATEHQRAVTVAGPEMGSMDRGWRVAVGGANLTIGLRATRNDPSSPRPGVAVDVNGADGRFQSRGGFDVVSWAYSRQVEITVTVSPTPAAGGSGDAVPRSDGPYRDLALQVARSVRPDGQTPVRGPVRFGWLPAGYTHHGGSLGGESRERWVATAVAAGLQHDSPSVEVSLIPETVEGGDGAVATTVRGRPGWYSPPRPEGPAGAGLRHSYLLVALDGGRTIRVSHSFRTANLDPSPLDQAALTMLADQLVIDESPDVSWIGR